MLQELINTNDFAKAIEYIKEKSSSLEKLNPFTLKQVLDKVIQAKQFQIIEALLEVKYLTTDLYELETFSNTIFDSIAGQLDEAPESLDFVRLLGTRLENANSIVENKSLIGLLVEKQAKPAVIKAFAEAGCDANVKNNHNENALHLLLKNNSIPTNLIAQYVNVLVELGCDLNEKNAEQKNALMIAASARKKEAVEALLAMGADPNEQDGNGNNAFYYIIVEQMNLELYEKLAQQTTPDFMQINKSGVTILFEFLRNLNSPNPSNLGLLKKIVLEGADLYQPCTYYSKQMLPIDWVAQKKSEVLQALLETEKLDLNFQDDKGNTLLHSLCKTDLNFDQNQAKELYKKVKMLLEKDIDVNKTNDEDKKPVDLAMDDNLRAKIVELLLNKK